MGKPIFTSEQSQFLKKNANLLDMVLGHMAIDIVRGIHGRVPVSNTKKSGNKRGGGGHLQASIAPEKIANGKFRVIANKEYAAFQERGERRDGSHVVRHYSTPGTGKHWFINTAEQITKNASHYIQEGARALGL